VTFCERSYIPAKFGIATRGIIRVGFDREHKPEDSMRPILLLGAMLLLSSSLFGSTCSPGTLIDYINLGSAGCDVNRVRFQDFFLTELSSFTTAEIDPALVQITPFAGTLQTAFLLTLNTTAQAGEVKESAFGFTATGSLNGASIELGTPAVAGDGAITGILDVCAGGFFLGVEPIGCDGTAATAIAFATAFDSQLSSSAGFPLSSFFNVFTDITIDGGLAGSASLDTATVAVATSPEPSVSPLVAAGLGTLSMLMSRRKRRR
jgi:hypothetical protein